METIKLIPGQLYSPLCQLRRWIGKPHPVLGFKGQKIRDITIDEILLFVEEKQTVNHYYIFLDKDGKELWLNGYGELRRVGEHKK